MGPVGAALKNRCAVGKLVEGMGKLTKEVQCGSESTRWGRSLNWGLPIIGRRVVAITRAMRSNPVKYALYKSSSESGSRKLGDTMNN